jgi:hypothetical protein
MMDNVQDVRVTRQWGQEPLSMEAEESTALGAVTKQQPVETQQTEKTQYVL